MKKLNLFLMLILLGFGVMTQTAQAQMTQAPDLSLQTTAGTGANALGASYNARIAIAPYAQVTANSTYTFIGVSHPSLDQAHTSIGVAVEAIDMTTVPNNAAGRAAVFTVHAGETHRVFIVNQSHATINSSNSDFAGYMNSGDMADLYIYDATHGSILPLDVSSTSVDIDGDFNDDLFGELPGWANNEIFIIFLGVNKNVY